MRIIPIALCILLFHVVQAGQVVLYVNTASTSGGDGTSNSTAGAHRAFASLYDACNSLGTGTLANQYTIYCDGSGGPDTTPLHQTPLNFVTTPANYVLITTTGAARHNGTWDTTAPHYWMSVTNPGGAIYCNIGSHIRIDGLLIYITVNDGASHNGIKTSNANQTPSDIDMRCANCIVLGNATSGTVIGYVSRWPSGGTSSNQGTSRFWNCIAINCNTGFDADWQYATAYNCTAYNCTYNYVADGVWTVINCLSANYGTFSFVPTFSGSSDYNAETGTDSIPGSHSRSSQTFSFVNAGAKNLLLTTSDTGALGFGMTDPGSGLFTNDIAGNVRTAPWSIGASQPSITQPIPSTNLVTNWRAVVGIPGGVPRYAVGTNVTGVDNTGATDVTATLNAIAAGLVNTRTAMVLPNGSYHITNSIHLKNYSALRGSGTNTFLVPYSNFPPIVVDTTGGSITTNGLATNNAVGDFTIKLLASQATLTAGCMMLVSELNDSVFVNPNGWEDQSGPHLCTYCDQRYNGTRVRGQMVYVTNVNGTVISFTPPLLTVFHTNLSAIAGWYAVDATTNNTARWIGVEDLTILPPAWWTNNLINFANSSFCWASNVNLCLSGIDESAGIQVTESMNDEVRHCWFTGYGSEGWGYHQWVDGGNCLFEDNIGQVLKILWGQSGVNCANVCFGNLSIMKTNVSTSLFNDYLFHGAHPDFTLIEANSGTKLDLDSIHGSSSRTAIFRNWWHERLTNSTYSLIAIQIDSTNYYASPVGNVLGYSGITTNLGWQYEYTSDGGGTGQPNIQRDFTYSLSGNNQHATDNYVKTSGVRDMNFSWVSNAVERAASGGATTLDNSILYPAGLSAGYPTGASNWWGGLAWPAFDPLTATNYVYDPQMTNSLPAAARYWAASQSGGGVAVLGPTIGGGAKVSGGGRIGQ